MKLLLSNGQGEIEVIDNTDRGHGEAFADSPLQKVTVSAALEPIVSFCKEALGKLRDVADPDELTIEFGIEAGGEGGLFGLAKAHLNATMTINAKWSKSS